jgi:hypothetical protein
VVFMATHERLRLWVRINDDSFMESWYGYPRNLSGLALLFLRVSVGLLLLANVHGEALFTDTDVVKGLAAVLCAGLCVGILTPLLGGIAFIGGMIYLFWLPAGPSLLTIVTLMLCVSLTIMGAGAYSIDGILFGRRRVIL